MREYTPKPGSFRKIGCRTLPTLSNTTSDISARSYWEIIKDEKNDPRIFGIEFIVTKNAEGNIITGKVVLTDPGVPWEAFDGQDIVLLGEIGTGSTALCALKNVRCIDSKDDGKVRILRAKDILYWEVV